LTGGLRRRSAFTTISLPFYDRFRSYERPREELDALLARAAPAVSVFSMLGGEGAAAAVGGAGATEAAPAAAAMPAEVAGEAQCVI
jgi:hypothetical protein